MELILLIVVIAFFVMCIIMFFRLFSALGKYNDDTSIKRLYDLTDDLWKDVRNMNKQLSEIKELLKKED